MTGDQDQATFRRRARLVYAAGQARWSGTMFLCVGILFEVLGRSALGVIVAGGLIMIMGHLILVTTRHRHPEDDPAELAKVVHSPGTGTSAPQPAAPRRNWHEVSIPPGSRYIDKGHVNYLAEQQLLRRAGALIFALTVLGCGIVGLFLFDGKIYPLTLISLGLIGTVLAGGFLLRFALELAAEKRRDWPHL